MTTEEENKKRIQQDFQKVLVELEMHKKQFESVSQQMQILENNLVEMNSTIEALNDLEGEKPGKEVLVPIGSVAYVKATLKDTKKILMGVGAGISIEKSINDSKKTFEERKKSLEKMINDLQENANEINKKISELNAISENLIRELRKE